MDYNKIKELCTARGLSIPQLAEKIGVSKSFYTSLKNETLSVSTLEKIADVLEVPISYFFSDEADIVILPKVLLKKLITKSNESIRIITALNEKILGVQKLSSKARIAQLEILIALNSQNKVLYEALTDEKDFKEMDSALRTIKELVDSNDADISNKELIEFSNDIRKLHTLLSKEFIKKIKSNDYDY